MLSPSLWIHLEYPSGYVRMGGVNTRLALAAQGLRSWTPRHWLVALASTLVVGLLLGWVTVLIPNPVFGRDVPPTSWSYPVWIVTAVLSGLLIATYVKTPVANEAQVPDEKLSAWGTVGALGSWFAIGCPVCNKLALLALGYSGALTYFGAAQPYLAAVSLVLLVIGLVFRLSGMVACEMPGRAMSGTPGRL